MKFIPKDKIRKALIAFLFKQVITWAVGLGVVELRLIEYPVRLFPYANRTSFSFEYFIYPSICAISRSC
ncbi:CBO0543 family protein [Desulfosporosinus orientis]|uniref:CBO0543 family protein n=1 Tax=Desulfosporosinus orientis TaxID=1563 RepID=UPI0031F46FF0